MIPLCQVRYDRQRATSGTRPQSIIEKLPTGLTYSEKMSLVGGGTPTSRWVPSLQNGQKESERQMKLSEAGQREREREREREKPQVLWDLERWVDLNRRGAEQLKLLLTSRTDISHSLSVRSTLKFRFLESESIFQKPNFREGSAHLAQ